MRRSTPEKRHALNKRVRKEKARLRKRGPKKHSRYEGLITYTVEVSPETMAKIVAEAKRTHTSRERVVRKCLNKFIKKCMEEDGVSEKLNIEMDEDTKQ